MERRRHRDPDRQSSYCPQAARSIAPSVRTDRSSERRWPQMTGSAPLLFSAASNHCRSSIPPWLRSVLVSAVPVAGALGSGPSGTNSGDGRAICQRTWIAGGSVCRASEQCVPLRVDRGRRAARSRPGRHAGSGAVSNGDPALPHKLSARRPWPALSPHGPPAFIIWSKICLPGRRHKGGPP